MHLLIKAYVGIWLYIHLLVSVMDTSFSGKTFDIQVSNLRIYLSPRWYIWSCHQRKKTFSSIEKWRCMLWQCHCHFLCLWMWISVITLRTDIYQFLWLYSLFSHASPQLWYHVRSASWFQSWGIWLEQFHGNSYNQNVWETLVAWLN